MAQYNFVASPNYFSIQKDGVVQNIDRRNLVFTRLTNDNQKLYISKSDNTKLGSSLPPDGMLIDLNNDIVNVGGITTFANASELAEELSKLFFLTNGNEVSSELNSNLSLTEWNTFNGSVADIILTENTTVVLDGTESTTLVLYTLQDGTGNHSITFNSMDFGEVESSQVTFDAGDITLYVLVKTPFDGKYRGTGKTFNF